MAYGQNASSSDALRNRSLSDARWFYNKKTHTIVKGKMYYNESLLSRNEMWCAADNQNYVCHMCKNIFRFELKLRLSSYWQNIKFS